MGGRSRHLGHGRLRGHGVPAGAGGHHPRRTAGDRGRLRFRGSVAVFAVVRKWGIPLVEVFFSREKLEKLSFLRTSPKRTALLWLVFTVPGTPKDLLCYFAGLTDLSWSSWLLIASVGRIPSIVTSTVGGDALGMQNYQFAVVTFLATLVIAGVGLLIYRQVCRRHDAHRGSADSDT